MQCKRLDFHYCDWWGSSRGMNAFIRHTLPQFAQRNPQIEIVVSPRPATHPVVRGHFVNGKDKELSVKNMEIQQILQMVELLRNDDGEPDKRDVKPVKSMNDNVRGIWSGLHNAKISIGLEGLPPKKTRIRRKL
jgi:large subunit ribosomal protein L43